MAEALGLEEALKHLCSTAPPRFLYPSPELSRIARTALAEIYSSLLPSCPKAPLDRLLVDEGFDAEQIWQQIELLSLPIISSLPRRLKRLPLIEAASFLAPKLAYKDDGGDDDDDEDDDDEEEEEGVVREGDDVDKIDEEEEEEDGEESEEGQEEGENEDEKDINGGVEDQFLKIKELEQYLEKDEAREYGIQKKKRGESEAKDSEDEKEEEEEDGDGGFDFGDFDDADEDEANYAEDARYEDFFGSKKRRRGKQEDHDAKKAQSLHRVGPRDDSEVLNMDDEQSEEDYGPEDDHDSNDKFLSTHEKHCQKIQEKIKQMEQENLETKSWNMQGEAIASKRPKNSALEVNLDFQHKVKPPPVITDEITACLEELIRKRIIEGHYDDVQRASALPTKAPKERKELDENKSQKGLAEIYEEDYALKTGLASAPLSSSDEQKKEATILFKKLCLKLDSLSHFHFAPKPVIEDMSVQFNLPALAMEEIAPLAVSDAAMLAPEEIFQGKGDIKDESELTQVDRKKRRANKKRKFKVEAAKKASKKARGNMYIKESTDARSC